MQTLSALATAPQSAVAQRAYLARTHFGALDGLRGVAVAAVVWHHTAGRAFGSGLGAAGDLGVQLFFAISGFLIATLLLREEDRSGGVRLSYFYARRALRIFPLYYAVLALYVVAVWLFERDTAAGAAFFSNLPYFVTYTSNWLPQGEGRMIFAFAWSLAVEEQFYLLWPTLARRVRRSRLMALLALLVAFGWWQQEGLWPAQWQLTALGAGLGSLAAHVATPLLLGVLLAHALHSPRGFAALHAALGATWAAPVVAGVCLLCVASDVVPQSLIYLLLVALVAACVVREDHGLGAGLRAGVLRGLGVVSYGIYLLHMLCAKLVERAGAAMERWLEVELELQSVSWGLVSFLGTLGLSFVVANVSHRTFEAWFLAWKAHFQR